MDEKNMIPIKQEKEKKSRNSKRCISSNRFRKRIRFSKRTRKKRKNISYSINSCFCCLGFPYYHGNER